MNYVFDASRFRLTLTEAQGAPIPTPGDILKWLDSSAIQHRDDIRAAAKTDDLSGMITRALLNELTSELSNAMAYFDGPLFLEVLTPNTPHPMSWRWAGSGFVPAQVPPYGHGPHVGQQTGYDNNMLMSYHSATTEITIVPVGVGIRGPIPSEPRPITLLPNMGVNTRSHLIPQDVVGTDRDIVQAALMAWPEIIMGPWTFVLPSGRRVDLLSAGQAASASSFTLRRLYVALSEPNEKDTILSENIRELYTLSPDNWTDLLADETFDDLAWLTSQLENGIQTIADYERALEIVEPLEAD